MTSPFRRLCGAFLAAAGISATLAATAPAVNAQSQAFQCDPGFYQVIAGQLAELDPGNETYNLIGPDNANVNAMDYRLEDGLLYGIAGGKLEQIDANGTRITVADLGIGGAYTGAFDDAGLLNASRGGRDWVKINIDTLEVTPVPEWNLYTAVADITNVHGVFYGLSSDGSLFSYDQTTMERREIGPVAGLPATHSAYGAAWSTAGGNLYIGRNTGQIYQITGYTTSTPQATQVGASPATNSNDGASCALAPPMAGLDDVDGPQSESEPRTDEAKEANDDYENNYDEISEGFIDAEETYPPEPEPEPEPTDEETHSFDDAGLGQGATCEAGGAEDRNLRLSTEDLITVNQRTALYNGSFDNPSDLDKWKIVSGSWNVADGALNQLHVCGYDYTALLRDTVVSNFELTARFHGTSINHGGLTFHHSSSTTRSGAFVVDLTDDGKTLRWGEYNELGYFNMIDSVEITAPAANQTVELSVTVHGSAVTIFMNGTQMGTAQATHASGLVGLISSIAEVSFEDVSLDALPAEAA